MGNYSGLYIGDPAESMQIQRAKNVMPITENQMEKQLETEVETAVM